MKVQHVQKLFCCLFLFTLPLFLPLQYAEAQEGEVICSIFTPECIALVMGQWQVIGEMSELVSVDGVLSASTTKIDFQ